MLTILAFLQYVIEFFFYKTQVNLRVGGPALQNLSQYLLDFIKGCDML